MWTRICLIPIIILLISCESDKESAYFQGALGLGTPRLLVASATGTDYAVVMYDTSGNYIRTIKNYVAADAQPRGIDTISGSEMIVALNRVDHLESVNYVTGVETSIYNASINGNVYQLRHHDTHGLFVIDSNNIESVDFEGARIGAPRITASIGGCTLSTPRSMDFDLQGRLLVTNTGNDDLLMYDVSDPFNTQCVVANTSMGNTNPVGILAHSDGNIYVSTQGDDSIYVFPADLTGAGTVIFNDTSIINNPTALLELPNGNILVASDGTNDIVEMQTDGTIINAQFISDSFTNSVGDMTLIYEGAP